MDIGTEFWAAVLITAYSVVVLATRYLLIVEPVRLLTYAGLATADDELAAAGLDAKAIPRAALAGVKQSLDHEKGPRRLLMGNALDLAAWNRIHDAQRAGVHSLPFERVRARLDRARGEIGALPPDTQAYWQQALAQEWSPLDHERARAMLDEYLVVAYDTRDTKFANLATVMTKVSWLTAVGLVALLILTQVGFHAVFAAGVIGGVVSRLRREMVSSSVPTDYGLAWTALFLAPVTGALSAWVGLLLLAALQSSEAVALQSLLGTKVTMETIKEPTAAMLGIAVLLGFSERLLDKITAGAEKSITPGASDAAPASVPAAPPPVAVGVSPGAPPSGPGDSEEALPSGGVSLEELDAALEAPRMEGEDEEEVPVEEAVADEELPAEEAVPDEAVPAEPAIAEAPELVGTIRTNGAGEQ